MSRGLQTFARLLMCAMATLASTGARADCTGTQPNISCTGVRSTLLYVDANTDAWIAISGNIAAVPCTQTGGLIRLRTAAPNFKTLYATLLAAHLTGREINVRIDPAYTECTVIYVTMP